MFMPSGQKAQQIRRICHQLRVFEIRGSAVDQKATLCKLLSAEKGSIATILRQ
jgi:hypothetical protein